MTAVSPEADPVSRSLCLQSARKSGGKPSFATGVGSPTRPARSSLSRWLQDQRLKGVNSSGQRIRVEADLVLSYSNSEQTFSPDDGNADQRPLSFP